MQLAESFAATYTPQFFSEKFFEANTLPSIEFFVVEAPEPTQRSLALDDNSGFASKAKSWVEETAQSFIHLPYDDLKVWKGINQTGAPAD